MSARGLLTRLLTFAVLLAVAPSVASATEAKPLGITSFTMQTTQARETQEVYNGKPVRKFVNEPYTFTQAGGHPSALTTTVRFAEEELPPLSPGEPLTVPTRDPKDVVVDLPPGLLGNPVAVPRCLLTNLLNHEHCRADTQVGEVRLKWFGGTEALNPIVNLTPEAGQSAEFGLETKAGYPGLLTAHVVRAGSSYTLTVTANDIPAAIELTEVETTFWGVPADPSHDAMRGLSCSKTHHVELLRCAETDGGKKPSGVTPVPFLTMPADCAAGPLTATVRADSWEEPGHVHEGLYEGYVQSSATLPAATGCGLLQFAPGIEVLPNTLTADEPVELGVNIQVPQDLQPAATATPQLRDAVVTLPEGMSISPGIVDGIQACNESGPEGINFSGPESEEKGLNGELQLAPGRCPNASTVGTAEAITPLLSEPVKGHVYLARPLCGGAGQSACTAQDALDGRLYQLYLELGGAGPLASTGVNIKARGYVEANPATGQLTTKFLANPQLPFGELKIRLNGGPRSPLDNPAVCGPATTTAEFTPWSAPGVTPEGVAVPGTPEVAPSTYFNVSGCSTPVPLSPGFLAGTVTPQAGRFSAFTLNFTRQDREQYLSGIQVHTPPGLLGMLSAVPLCGEPQAAQGTCPEASKIGTTRVASGAGSHPFEIGGNVYLTTGYKGAPFGLSIVTNAVAGPFNLGLVIVRSRIDVDPTTSQLTVTSDPLPQIVFGVPLRLKRVTVNIDRPNFMFNPTSCTAHQITAVVTGAQNAVANVASPFAAAGCRSLAFGPRFTVSTNAHTSRLNGASLDAQVTYPESPTGTQANITWAKVELPRQLPSRLTTLQKACLAAVFAANPAGCPPQSVVGIARASTPVLPVALSGPVYFVSHGGEAFPSLIVVLQGDGVRVDLTGSTFISRTGITSSTFKTVPDVPIHTFELYLPEGRYSALAANTNLCNLTSSSMVKRRLTRHIHGRTTTQTITTRVTRAAGLTMPTEFIAHNGAVIHQNTPISVIGCATTAKAAARERSARQSTTRGARR